MISFKRLLPLAMRTTKWGSLIEVWQSIWTDIKTNKAKLIFNQYDYEDISDDDLKDLAVMFGFDLKSNEGLTSTSLFLKRELETLTPRIVSKSTENCYKYQGIPFGLISNGYAVSYNSDSNKFFVVEDQSNISLKGTLTLDRDDPGNLYTQNTSYSDTGYYSDEGYYGDEEIMIIDPPSEILTVSYLDDYSFISLDGSENVYQITRNFVFDYEHKYIENVNEFLSIDSLQVLQNDVNQFKRITERCYFEPYLCVDVNSNKTLTTKTWFDFSCNLSVNQSSILFSDTFENLSEIRFGTGAHSIFSGITDVDSFTYNMYYSGLDTITETDTQRIFRTYIEENLTYSGIVNQYFSGFTELALWDASGNCMLYSTFPKIQWDDNMFCNIKFNFQLI